MPDLGLSAALPGATTTRGDASRSSPNAPTVAMGDNDYPSRRSSDAVPTPSGTEHSALSPARSTSPPNSHARLCNLCRCRLSRYNREDICSGCVRSGTAVQPARPFVPSHVWLARKSETPYYAWTSAGSANSSESMATSVKRT